MLMLSWFDDKLLQFTLGKLLQKSRKSLMKV